MKDEQVGIFVTGGGYVKRLTIDNYMEHFDEVPPIRDGDYFLSKFECSIKDTLVMLTTKGNYLTLPVMKLNTSRWQSDGEHINSFTHLDGDERIIATLVLKDFNNVGNTKVIMISKQGMGKATYLKDFQSSRINKPSLCMKLKNDDDLVNCFLSHNDNDNFLIVTKNQKGMKLKVKDVPLISLRTGGNKIVKLTSDSVIYASNDNKNFLTYLYDSKEIVIIASEKFKRKKKAHAPERVLDKPLKSNLIAVFQAKKDDIITITDDNYASQSFKYEEFFSNLQIKEKKQSINAKINFNMVRAETTNVFFPKEFKLKKNNVSKVEAIENNRNENQILRATLNKKFKSNINKKINFKKNVKTIQSLKTQAKKKTSQVKKATPVAIKENKSKKQTKQVLSKK